MTTTAAPEWFTQALAALRAGNVDGFLQMYADDAVHEFPFAEPGRPARLEGKAAIAAYMRNLPARVKFDSFAAQVREAGDELIIEATAHGTRPDSGAPFDMQYVWFITHKNGRVSRFRDYMNRSGRDRLEGLRSGVQRLLELGQSSRRVFRFWPPAGCGQ